LGLLLLTENLVSEVAVFILIDQNMLRLRHQTVVNAAVPPNGLLISSGVEKPDVHGLGLTENRQVNGISMLLGVIVIVCITRKSTQEYTLIGIVPTVQRQHDKLT